MWFSVRRRDNVLGGEVQRAAEAHGSYKQRNLTLGGRQVSLCNLRYLKCLNTRNFSSIFEFHCISVLLYYCLYIFSAQHESQALSLAHLEEECEYTQRESVALKSEINNLRAELEKCDDEIDQCKQRIR